MQLALPTRCGVQRLSGGHLADGLHNKSRSSRWRAAMGTTGTPKSRARCRSSTIRTMARFVHQVQADHHPVGDLQDLQHQIQVALQRRGVGHHDRHIRLAEQQEIARDSLRRGWSPTANTCRAGRRACTCCPPIDEPALGARDRLARPVARVLAQPVSALKTVLLPTLGLPASAIAKSPSSMSTPRRNRLPVLCAGHVAQAEAVEIMSVMPAPR